MAGLPLAVLTTFKELYLLSKFITRTLSSVKNSRNEREDLREEFYLETLFLRSLYRLVLRGDSILEKNQLNQECLSEIHKILERLRMFCGDYAKIAAQQDEEYQAFSPYLNSNMVNTTVVEFDLDIKEGSTTSVGLFEGPKPKKSLFGGIWTRKSVDVESWKWALFERRKVEQLLRKFQKWTGKLKKLVTLTFTLHPRYNDPTSLANLVKSEDASRLGLAPHVRIRQLTIQTVEDKTDFDLGACVLKTSQMQPSGLTVARLKNPMHAHAAYEDVLVEFKEYPQEYDCESPGVETEKMVGQLASLLASSGDDKLQTLGFRGYIHQESEKQYAFIFNFPEGSQLEEPISLHSLLSVDSSKRKLSLSQRFRVAQTIAQSIGAFHADGWVHKSICSDSIVFFRKVNESLQESYNNPYLVNFEFSRPESAGTAFTFDDHLEKNIYRHPERQGPPTVKFSKIHDIYSLGVVLLEIGLWQTAMSLYQDANTKLKQGVTMNPRGIQNFFTEVAKRRLPHHMGSAYLDAVVSCLSGKLGDALSPDFPMVFEGQVVAQIDVKQL